MNKKGLLGTILGLASDDSQGKIAGIKAAIKRLEKSNDKSEFTLGRIDWLNKELKKLEKLKDCNKK